MAKTVSRTRLAQGNSHPAWGGHFPATRTALEGILSRAISGRCQASLQERVLATICEFRGATANRDLTQYLETGTLRKLTEVRFALNEIGAMDIAAFFSVAIDGLRRTSSLTREAAVLLRLEQRLLSSGRVLDESIARYALRIQTQDVPSVRPRGIE